MHNCMLDKSTQIPALDFCSVSNNVQYMHSINTFNSTTHIYIVTFDCHSEMGDNAISIIMLFFLKVKTYIGSKCVSVAARTFGNPQSP